MLRLVRLTIWGHALGYLLMAASTAVADAPTYFGRVSPWSFVIPLAAVAVIQILHVDLKLAARLPTGVVVVLGLIPAAAAATSWLLVLLAFRGVPLALLSADTLSGRAVAAALLLYYLVLIVAFVVLGMRANRAPKTLPHPQT